jgi:hypothetical protein
MKPWLKTFLTFLIGFLLGVAATGLAFRFCFHPHPPGGADADRVLKRLDSKLGFTADQKEKVAALLKQELPKADALRQEADGKFQALRESFRDQLRPLLNPDQLKKFNDMTAQWDKRQKENSRFLGCGAPVSTDAVTGR